MKAIAGAIRESIVCGLARANDNDVNRAGEALKEAAAGRIHTFIATSPIHMERKLRMQPDQVIEQAVKSVKLARRYRDDVEFSPEDAGRSEVDFLCRILEQTIKAGATTINIPDTVGYTMPEQFGNLIRTLRERIPNSDKVVWSVHCHNDLGVAVANSLSAVMDGARQVECTVNGLGERAGNASLEEIVMAVRTRQDYFSCATRIDTTEIIRTSRLVSAITGFQVQPNKAIVGANAFAHESGIHQDGVIKSRETYEIMRAEDVGWTTNKLVLGKLSGRNAFKQRLKELGVPLASEESLNAAFARFKELADKKSEIFDEDLQTLVSDEAVAMEQEHFRLLSMMAHSGNGRNPGGERGDVRGRLRAAFAGAGQRAGGCHVQGDREHCGERRRAAAVFGQQHHLRDRLAGRGHRAVEEEWPHRERGGGRHRHRGGFGQGLHQCAEQAAFQAGAAESADVARPHRARQAYKKTRSAVGC